MKQVLKLALLLTSACAFSNHSFASNPLAAELTDVEAKAGSALPSVIPQEQISGIAGKAGSALPSVAPQDSLTAFENNLSQLKGDLKTLKSLVKKQTKNNNNNVSVNNNNNVDSNLIGSIVKVANGLNKVNSSINSNEQLKASVGKIGIGVSNNTSLHAKGMAVPDVATLVSLAGNKVSSFIDDGQFIGDAQTLYTTTQTVIDLVNTLRGILPSNDSKVPAVPAHNSPVKVPGHK